MFECLCGPAQAVDEEFHRPLTMQLDVHARAREGVQLHRGQNASQQREHVLGTAGRGFAEGGAIPLFVVCLFGDRRSRNNATMVNSRHFALNGQRDGCAGDFA